MLPYSTKPITVIRKTPAAIASIFEYTQVHYRVRGAEFANQENEEEYDGDDNQR